MTFTPFQWIQIAIANAFGQDKQSFTQRLAWFNLSDRDLDPAEAEEPAYAYALKSALEGNDKVRIHLDATASGTQILAAFANCWKSGSHCNLFGEARRDAYTDGWQAMGMTEEIDRASFKSAFMTSQFGSKKVPREALGEANLPAFYEMYQREFPGVWGVLGYIQGLWQSDVHSHRWTMPDGFEVIQLNTGIYEEPVELFGEMVVVRKQVRTEERRGIALAANITHSADGFICREMVKRAQFDPQEAKDTIEFGFPSEEKHYNLDALLYLYRKTQFLSVDLIACMNSQTFCEDLSEIERLEIDMLMGHLAEKEQFNMVPIHDSFSCEARYCNDLCAMYRYLMQQLWDSSLLESIAEDITGKRVEIKKYATVLDGVHMIC
jgi:hypothetical protein